MPRAVGEGCCSTSTAPPASPAIPPTCTWQRRRGRSVARLLRSDGLGGLLAAAGYVVSPNPPTLGGHHTLETYGSSHAEGIDAIQIEIVAALRASTARRGVLIDDLARAIASLVDNDVLDGGAQS